MIDYVIGGEYLNVISNKGAQPYINMSRDIAGYKHKISMIKTLIKEEEKVGTS